MGSKKNYFLYYNKYRSAFIIDYKILTYRNPKQINNEIIAYINVQFATTLRANYSNIWYNLLQLYEQLTPTFGTIYSNY